MGLKAPPRAPPLSPPPLGRTLDGFLGAAAPLGVGNPKGGAAPPPFPLYICEVLGLLDTRERLPLGAALPLSLLVSSSA